ncbi:MAG: UMP kinase [Candidatus Brocadiales bacterium]
MAKAKYNRAVIKISGEEFGTGIDTDSVNFIAGEIKDAVATNARLALVVGGGNMVRGSELSKLGMSRAQADSAGMVATIINALALQDAVEKVGLVSRVQSAIAIQAVAEPYIRRRAVRHMEKGRVVLFAGGTGNPYMSTDTAASLRALEIDAEALLMAKYNVDGVYDSDPALNAAASKFGHLTYLETLRLRLQALDSTALSMCMDNSLPIVVFNMFVDGNLGRVLAGEQIGTLISETAPVPSRSD